MLDGLRPIEYYKHMDDFLTANEIAEDARLAELDKARNETYDWPPDFYGVANGSDDL